MHAIQSQYVTDALAMLLLFGEFADLSFQLIDNPRSVRLYRHFEDSRLLVDWFQVAHASPLAPHGAECHPIAFALGVGFEGVGVQLDPVIRLHLLQ